MINKKVKNKRNKYNVLTTQMQRNFEKQKSSRMRMLL